MRAPRSTVFNERLAVWEEAWRRGPWAYAGVAAPRKSIAFGEALAAAQRAWRLSWRAEIEAAARAKVEALDGDCGLLMQRICGRRGTDQEWVLLGKLIESDKLKYDRRGGG
jgi:hypothetical protein